VALLPFLLAVAATLSLARGPQETADSSPEPLRGTPEERWSFGPLAFEGAPIRVLVPEGERVLVHGRDSTQRRALVVLDGASGRVLTRTLFPARSALAVAAEGEHVAVRTDPGRVELYRLRGARLIPLRAWTNPQSLSRPLLGTNELLLREGGELACYALDAVEPKWRVRAMGSFLGDPDVRGEHVFAGWRDANGLVHLAVLARASGQGRADLALGRTRAPLADEPDSCTVTGHADGVFLRLEPALLATNGAHLPWAHVPFDGKHLSSPRLFDFLAAPLETRTGWVAPERLSDGSPRWLLARRGAATGEGTIELASRDHHAWLCQGASSAGRAGEVLYIGPAAVDERTLQVLWRRERAGDFAPVPVPRGLLVIEAPRLLRLGQVEPPAAPGRERARQRAVAEERELGERLALLASKALRGGDAAHATELAAEAEGLGASGRTLELVRSEAERMRGKTTADARREARRSALGVEERAARAALVTGLAEAAELAREPHERRALLEELFRREPLDARGLEVLAQLLPQGVGLGESPSLAWLELAAATERTPLRYIEADEAEAGPRPSPSAARLMAEREAWRADACAWESARLLVVTAGPSPQAAARTLATGEFLCGVLEQVFGGARGGSERLELVVYPTREEYLAHSGTDLGGLESVLGFTAGHFDLGARVSRLYVPEEDADGERLLDVAAHELTHHWLALRSRFAPLAASPATPGFWIVEGIATWVEELALDPQGSRWSTDVERAPSLDTLRNAGVEELLSWRELLAASFETYAKLETRTTCLLALDWQLGVRHPRSPMQLFYAQSAALAHYLYEAEGGRHRALFLEAVEGFYRGRPADVSAALGLAPEELGARVQAWARAKR
jgi:hypothetical protein